jgi:periplasmic protein TonB
MFNNLLESKAKKQRSFGAWLLSNSIFIGLTFGAVYATANATAVAEKPKEEKVEFVEMKKDEPPPPKNEPPPPPPPDVAVAPPPPKGFQVLSAPVEIPDIIPQVDLSKKVTDEADFSGKGVAGGVAKGVAGGTGPVVSDQPYFEFQVEKPVVPAPGNTGPRYPEMLKSANVEGTVLAQFVVDTLGRVEAGSFKVLKSDHDLFTQSVKSALTNMKFLPAEVGGRRVKQLVQQPFQFQLTK